MARARSLSPRAIVAGVIAIALLTVGAFAVGRLSAPVSSDPGTTSAEAGFARDMREHHVQAVDMSMTVRDLTDDPDIRLLAYDIAMTQQSQAGQMLGWLAEWKLTTTRPEPSMTWMTRPTLEGAAGHAHSDEATETTQTPGDRMPGMATKEQLDTLAGLEGVEAEKYFLTLMIAHHKGGVEMAESVLDRSNERVVVQLARGVVKSQSAEIELMQQLLDARS